MWAIAELNGSIRDQAQGPGMLGYQQAECGGRLIAVAVPSQNSRRVWSVCCVVDAAGRKAQWLPCTSWEHRAYADTGAAVNILHPARTMRLLPVETSRNRAAEASISWRAA